MADEPRPEPPEWPTLSWQMRHHFGDQPHLYAVWLAAFADDLDRGGVLAVVCRGHERPDPGAALQLRLLAAIHRIVLAGRAPTLTPFFPNLGGTADPGASVPLVLEVISTHTEELRAALDQPPQTNEIGRAANLAIGLFHAVRQHGLSRVRLLELGASGGLNLNVDRFHIFGPGWTYGPADSPVQLDSQAVGALPLEVQIVERRGCDLAPVDAASPEGARWLESFVWPFNTHRYERLEGALRVLREHPVIVDQADVAEWIVVQLAAPAPGGVLTVVWQSITEQYWPPAVSAAVGRAIEEARLRMPLARITMEGRPSPDQADRYDVIRLGPRTSVDGVVIAGSHHHGPPIALLDPFLSDPFLSDG